MATNLTYPGVYVQEIPSGVRTITGVSTAVTAFIGSAKRGAINDPIRIQSFSDFEREFGGLDASSEMSYAVRQFFLNGGSDAFVIRVAKDPTYAEKTLKNSNADDVLKLTALRQGKSENQIEILIDYNTTNPGSTFNLNLNRVIAGDPGATVIETFPNLSMNEEDVRYVEDIVNGESLLVEVERVATPAVLGALGQGTSTSGAIVDGGGTLLDVATLIDDRHNQFRVQVNGSELITVQVSAGDATGANATARLALLCAAIQTKVRAAANGVNAIQNFTCAPQGNTIVMTSGTAGEASSVRVYRGERNDLSSVLRHGPDSGGTEVDAAATIRPDTQPKPGTLTSTAFSHAEITALDPNLNKFNISLDGGTATTVTVGLAGLPAQAGNSINDRLTVLAQRIQTTVRAADPSKTAYKLFTASAANNQLTLASGTTGTGSSVIVSAATADDGSTQLKLTGAGIATTQPQNVMLEGGNELPFTASEAFGVYIASRNNREGIYALEDVDIFNIMVLAGVTDEGILSEAIAYCQERRAFLIVDSPKGSSPSAMENTIKSLPKSNYGAVYYPWVQIADPLKNGKLRSTAPSGTIAGLYSRTDSSRGVWKAPAGTEANLAGVHALDYVLTDGQNGVLNVVGVNCLRTFNAAGQVAWGARTLRGSNDLADEYKYVPVRRLALYIEESLYAGTQWVVFEPNDEALWSQIRLNVGAFMQNLFQQGAFQGNKPSDAYLVKCDSETTTQYDIDRGVVNVLVGFAPLKPAEFVLLQIQQLAGQNQ
jgi:phage tail sheath protein FI